MRLQNHYHRDACNNLDIIAKREAKYLKNVMTQIQTIYKPPTNRRRGLIDGIGSIAKTLFGTMDANDEKHINEQLNLLENKQQTLQHVVRTQIKVVNNTIAHIEKLENIIDRNEKLLQKRVTVYTERAEINEHFIIITAVITELIRDAENTIEYLTYIRKGAMHPKLMPIETIITHLKEATQQLQPGMYFPFKIHAEDWLAIEEYTKISAFYDKRNVYTILRFPLITQPSYDIINVITFPVPMNNNIFTVTEINNKIIAIDKEKLTYLRITESDLKNCIEINSQYTCENTIPIYRMNQNAPCEIQMYTLSRQHNCNTQLISSKNAIWTTLRQPHTWLYATATDQQITIQCDNRHEQKRIIKNTGKITLKGKCKLTTTDMTLQSIKTVYETSVETYLPEINITLLQIYKTHDNDTLENVTLHRTELIKLKNKLEELNNNLQDNEQNFFVQKQFVYPMATSGIITIIIIAIVTYIIIKNKKRKIKRPSVRIYDEEPRISYGLPRPILKRSLSTRF